MRRLSVGVLMTLVLFSFAWGQANPDFGQVWHASDQNPTFIEYPVEGTWNNGGIGFSMWGHAMWDGEQYRMYTSRKGPDPEGTHSIGLFYTSHLDSAWVPHEGNPIFEPAPGNWDSSHVATPMVIKDGDIYKMWYSAWSTAEGWSFGYAESFDGLDWVRHATPIFSDDPSSSWDVYWGLLPYVVMENDSTYMMYYAGRSELGDDWKIGMALSADGINWTREIGNPVIGLVDGWCTDWVQIPVVKKVNDTYVMWFSGKAAGVGKAQIGTAISDDGIHWRKDNVYNPVASQGLRGSWNEVGIYPLGVFEDDGEFKLYYGGIDQSDDYIGYGYSEYHPTSILPGNVSGTWTKAGSPYRVEGEITIPDGETLTLEPGTTVEFLGHYPLNVQGQILAIGTDEEPIRFMVDDTLEFCDNASYEGVWGGIRFDGTPATNDSSCIKNSTIQFGKTFAGGGGYFEGDWGGAIGIRNVNKLLIDSCLIQHNRAIGNVSGTAIGGGGIAIRYHASPEITNNIIRDNIAKHLINHDSGSGGGIMVYNQCNPRISGNKIMRNRATESGGGLSIWENCSTMVVNNLIAENECFTNNDNGGAGGGVAIGWAGQTVFMNNTIAHNSAGWTGGGLYSRETDAIFINTIIANNEDMDVPDEYGSQIGTWGMRLKTLTFQNSCLEGGEELIEWEAPQEPNVLLNESIIIDPRLLHNYGLNYTRSPCLGAGTSSCEIDGVTYCAPVQDINGHACPDPPGSNPDMGTFESNLSGHRISSAWNWWEWPESPTFMPGAHGTYDYISVNAPDVLFYEGQYHMWYAGNDGNRLRVCHATSVDGLDWVRDPANPILTSDPDTWMNNGLNTPRVVIVDDIFHMWFVSNSRTGHATSTDGIEWLITDGPVLEGTLGEWDSDLAAIADVIYHDSLFQAWYTGANNNDNRIGYATSTDGIEWAKDVENNPVFGPSDEGWDSGRIYSSSVIYNGNNFYMWYSGRENTEGSSIGRASSHNGINWTHSTSDAPVIGHGVAGSWNAAASFYPAVILHQGKYEMWFNGAPTMDSGWRIGYATMEPVDVESSFAEIPQSFLLSQNYPNPFNPMTHIRYSLPENGDIRLVVYDVLGREVVELINDYRSVGNYETTWYGLDRHGNQVSTGVYFARLEAGRNVDVIKMLYLK